ncbi:HK97 family phage prohead protease [Methylobacterium sp. NEAU 140]|uniref:HK97 family phage prohead protease n=1 Tax=Methylobacterium sp. NEAU 140 TaxID=3064945 RepID=UPI002733D124|nr:HK97 family phage prohead protease [Methylobacterium sp. NEAU 140]MDP4021420.1 HK97 family phage prohead protease [Methylobacterium sp. NEAU 140]
MDGHFTGYASVFGVPDLGRDVVVAGAFAGSLARRGAGGVRMLFQHDPAEPIGRWIALREDARGLFAEGQLNLAVQRAREVDALMRGGGLDGLSIGFRTLRARPGAGGERRLLGVDLWEISLVTFPLQPGARASPDLGPDSGPSPDALRGLARRIAPVARPLARSAAGRVAARP